MHMCPKVCPLLTNFGTHVLRESLDPIELQENIQKSLKKLFHLMKPESIL